MSANSSFWGTPREFFDALPKKTAERKKYVFLIGNGFNRFIKDEFNRLGFDCPPIMSWDELVIQTIVDNNELKQKLDERLFKGKGITNTEKVRLLELAIEGRNLSSDIAKSIRKYYDLKDEMWGKALKDEKKCFRCDLLGNAIRQGNHILTINFDNNIEGFVKNIKNADCSIQYVECQDKTNSKFTNAHPLYGWNRFSTFNKKVPLLAANESTDTAKIPPGIWHIHGWAGTNEKSQKGASIKLSFQKYCACISRIKQLGDYNKLLEWKGRNTWLNLFLNRPLIIAGLGLPQEEIFLRYLFLLKYKLEQKKADQQDNTLLNSYYLTLQKKEATQDSQPDGCDFLRALGVNIVEFDSYADLYNHQLWK